MQQSQQLRRFCRLRIASSATNSMFGGLAVDEKSKSNSSSGSWGLRCCCCCKGAAGAEDGAVVVAAVRRATSAFAMAERTQEALTFVPAARAMSSSGAKAASRGGGKVLKTSEITSRGSWSKAGSACWKRARAVWKKIFGVPSLSQHSQMRHREALGKGEQFENKV
eukprot:CAMPEP_0206524068 /NCGR_PEP_ID=MMETSP0324_2-20121206/67984_1 /ASSEMBLY_ACC=CAM_ASM_000836 /TAXON_ID=2866 /ORGANISM="Crypthecodinium cohnii, Strain Seligo" /LENGTH=165 /DNA_ID=CAMNT_0054018605 /DNA_START=16 /DNA_END=514 /DNA_ORIENTATION=+